MELNKTDPISFPEQIYLMQKLEFEQTKPIKYRMSHRYWAKFKFEYINEDGSKSEYGSRFPSTGPGSQVRILNIEIEFLQISLKMFYLSFLD